MPTTESNNSSPSASSTYSVNSTSKSSSSLKVTSLGNSKVGESFTGVTITETGTVTIPSLPSSTLNIRFSVPFQSGKAEKYTVNSLISIFTFIFPDTVNIRLSPSSSLKYPEKFSTNDESSGKVKLSGMPTTGRSLTLRTDSVKACSTNSNPSDTFRIISWSPISA